MARSRVPLFMGSHHNKIDAKGRVAVPADFRKVLDLDDYRGITCMPSFCGRCLDAGGIDLAVRMRDRLLQLPPYDPRREAMEFMSLSQMRPLPMDKDGRIIMPPDFCKKTDLEGEITFVGRGDYFQIWNKAAFETVLQQAAEIAAEARFDLMEAAPVALTGDHTSPERGGTS